jgi:hypothetical protein
MAEQDKSAFGEQLYTRLQGKGLSKYQVDKVLALQRLDPEVSELGTKGLLGDAQLLEISKINSAARQKQLAELSVEKNLPPSWVKELTKLVRSAEKARTDAEANRFWDFFFEVKEMIEKEGPTRVILQLIKGFSPQERGRESRTEVAEQNDRTVVSFNKMDLELGRGLDMGTVNICASAKKGDSGETVFNIQRNAFLDVRSDAFTKKMLMKLGIDYITQGDKGYVIGDPAFELANIFEKNTRRPMKDGMISPVEPEALLIVSLLVAQLLGHPKQVGEVCAFSVPADPIDVERNVIYHRGAIETILRKLGYTPRPMLEGHSIVFAELKEQDYTGIGISCGGGMFNVCVAYKSVPALTFSTSRGGDWIDNNVATAIGMPASLVCTVKESGVDLLNPKDRVQDAICIYYRNLIQYTLETMKQKMESTQNLPTFNKPIPLVTGGGTSMITGFVEVFKEEFEKVNFPVEVSEIRMCRNPLKAVAAGCLQAAIEETRALTDVSIQVAPAALERTVAHTSKADEGTKRRLGPMVTRQPAGGAVPRVEPKVVAAPQAPAARRDNERIVRSAPAPLPTVTASERKESVKTETRIKPKPFDSSPPKIEPKKPEVRKPEPKKPEPEPVLEEVTDLEELEIEELQPERKNGDESNDLPLIS